MSAENPAVLEVRLDELPLDEERGTMGMLLAITTEALLFASMFFAYFYIGHSHRQWPSHPPKIMFALIMLGVLVSSSIVLHLGESALKKNAVVAARLWVALTVLLGIAFLVIQTFEYRKHMKETLPTANAYSSLFYTITSLHGLHVAVGLAMLVYVLVLPTVGRKDVPPHRPLHNASLYWHFVDVVWIFIVLLLYLLPQWTR